MADTFPSITPTGGPCRTAFAGIDPSAPCIIERNTSVVAFARVSRAVDVDMGIKFPVGVGTILLCDYRKGGFQPPEMVKLRPAIVISPRLPHRSGLCTVIPISADQPDHEVDYVVRLEFDPPLPDPFSYKVAWAKCDMLATVGFARLDLFHTERDQYGKRKYLHPKLSEVGVQRVRNGMLHAVGCGNLTLTAE
jgi:uncharacterized protein YifN (PemK superfamily)